MQSIKKQNNDAGGDPPFVSSPLPLPLFLLTCLEHASTLLG